MSGIRADHADSVPSTSANYGRLLGPIEDLLWDEFGATLQEDSPSILTVAHTSSRC